MTTSFPMTSAGITLLDAPLGGVRIAPWAATPFLLLLMAMAVVPLLRKRWWETRYPFVSFGLAGITIVYYLFFLRAPEEMLHSGLEYLSFIALVGSLYVIAGGIHIRLRGKSSPVTNVVFLAIGALVSNLVGTTGASMILIRPYLRVNRYRIKPFHIVFFIFVVSNVGGALTPIGDPPLFLGYLQGIPFLWPVLNLWHIWLVALLIILGVFFVIDRRDFLKLSASVQHRIEEEGEHGEVVGLHNIFFLGVVLAAVFVTDPPFVREAMMMLAAAGSYFTTRREIHKKNDFDFLPIKEVAILFLGIFVTMVPALEWIKQNSAGFGIERAEQFYWSTGALSSVLDNAPTYLNFFSAAIGLFVNDTMIQHVHQLMQTRGAMLASVGGDFTLTAGATYETLVRFHSDLVAAGNVSTNQIATAYLLTAQKVVVQAISIGAVFFGAITYIGNGPNLMVKSIAEQSGVECPSFGGYVFRYAVPVLLPTFVLLWLVFFHQ